LSIGVGTTCGKALPLQGCYCFVLTQQSYNASKAICNAGGFNLISMDDQYENSVIVNYLAGGGFGATPFWIGGSIPNGTNWVWADGKTIPSSNSATTGYANWCFNQPNSNSPTDHIVLYGSCWYDTPSTNPSNSYFAICEKQTFTPGSIGRNYAPIRRYFPPPDKK